jgi:hypothetical protein
MMVPTTPDTAAARANQSLTDAKTPLSTPCNTISGCDLLSFLPRDDYLPTISPPLGVAELRQVRSP